MAGGCAYIRVDHIVHDLHVDVRLRRWWWWWRRSCHLAVEGIIIGSRRSGREESRVLHSKVLTMFVGAIRGLRKVMVQPVRAVVVVHCEDMNCICLC